jgi:uncharacterized membrane protein YkoI
MKRRSPLGLVGIALMALSTVPTPILARQGFAPDSGQVRESRRAPISLDEAVARVRRQTGGRILSAETVQHNHRVMHRIKVLLPSGHVRIISVDASG